MKVKTTNKFHEFQQNNKNLLHCICCFFMKWIKFLNTTKIHFSTKTNKVKIMQSKKIVYFCLKNTHKNLKATTTNFLFVVCAQKNEIQQIKKLKQLKSTV